MRDASDTTPDGELVLVSANHYTIGELTNAYNRTRVDYLIPMPMNPARLQEYVTLYDINLEDSRVALLDGEIVGLGMLGVRQGMGWITRLGVLPNGRRRGVGSAILNSLLEAAAARDIPHVWLEVIQGNEPAHELFKKSGFMITRELVVARRAPKKVRGMAALKSVSNVRYLQHDELVDLHCRRTERINWLNSVETMRNIRRLSDTTLMDVFLEEPRHELSNLSGFSVEFRDGSQGWVSYLASIMQLKQICVEVVRGEPAETTACLLELMHRLHATQDAVVENIPDDECWTGFQQAGYFEVFRRVEMVRGDAPKIATDN